jgi:hypothetical protein
LFPSICGIRYNKLRDDDKQELLYDVLPPYYIEKMKEAKEVPLKMNVKEVKNYALNIKEASTSPGR